MYPQTLCSKVREYRADLGIAHDGDADRVGGLMGDGAPLTTHQIICLLLRHYVKNRGMKGRVVKALTTTSMVDKMCAKLGLELVETGVGFKYIAGEIIKGGVLLGFEESGGIGFPGHIPERDGIAAGLVLLELLAMEKKPLKKLLADKEAALKQLEDELKKLCEQVAALTEERDKLANEGAVSADLEAELKKPAAAPGATASGGGATAGAAAMAVGEGSVTRFAGSVRLADGKAVSGQKVLFVTVYRNAQGTPPPVSSKRLDPNQVPTAIRFTENDLLMGGEWPEQVWVRARLDADGAPGAGPGDLDSPLVGPITLGQEGVELILGG
jgi:hypothetical protein